MGILLKVGTGNILYDGFTSIRVFKSIETLSSEFEFEATIQDPAQFPIKLKDTCKVYINDIQVIDGFIEGINGDTSANSHSISISGRDKTCDVVDSSVFENLTFNTSISLVDLIKKTLSQSNITGIDVIDNVGDIEIFEKNDNISAEMGESLFSFIERYCRKRQVLCNTDGLGNITLERASNDIITRLLLSESGEANNNNIKNIFFGLDNTNRFNKIKMKGQGNPTNVSLTPKVLTDVSAEASDDDIRTSRNLVLTSDSSLDTNTAKLAANWHVNIRRARSLNVNITTAGFSYDENDETKIWLPNKGIVLKDDFWNINAQLLIKSVEYLYNVNQGSICNIELTNRDAYTLEAEETEIFKKNEPKGNDLIKLLTGSN